MLEQNLDLYISTREAGESLVTADLVTRLRETLRTLIPVSFESTDIVVKSAPWTMPARHQDVWWRPTTDIGLTEARWVRAVEMRPGSVTGRKITHHAVAYLAQDDPDSIVPGTSTDLRGRAMLMEWAIGKGYDLYRPDTGKLLLPGAKISFDIHYHAVGEEIRDDVELGIWLYPKGQEPRHRSYLVGFTGLKNGTTGLDIPP